MPRTRWTKALLFAASLCATWALNGCAQKTFFPAVLMSVTAVTPARQSPSGSASAGYSVTPVAISLRSESGVAAYLVGYSIEYSTNLGEKLTNLSLPLKTVSQLLPANAVTDVSLDVYSTALINYYRATQSAIGPVDATITLFIHDINGNDITRQAHCLLDGPTA